MFELFDEIGKHHCTVIETVAIAAESPDDPRLPNNDVMKLRRKPRSAVVLLVGGRRYILVPFDVYSQLLSHGLIERPGGESSVASGSVDMLDGGSTAVHHGVLSARGKDFYARKGLFRVLSCFSARTNKWIVFGLTALVFAQMVVSLIVWLVDVLFGLAAFTGVNAVTEIPDGTMPGSVR